VNSLRALAANRKSAADSLKSAIGSHQTAPNQQHSGGQLDEQQQQQQMNSAELANIEQQLEQQHHSSGQLHQPQSFLIPMALVQTSSSEADSAPRLEPERGPSGNGGRPEQQQQQQVISSADSQLHPLHAQLGAMHADLQQPHQQHQQQQQSFVRSPAQMYRQSLANNQQLADQQQQQQWGQPPVASQGFMSSFLMGEKEKMTAAALRLQSHSQLLAAAHEARKQQVSAAGQLQGQAAAHNSLQQHQHQSQAHSSALSANGPPQATLNTNLHQPTNTVPQSSASNNLLSSSSSSASFAPPAAHSNLLDLLNPKGPGGLMPPIMMPYSRMPDNAIGQAYGAAVGSALPAESGKTH